MAAILLRPHCINILRSRQNGCYFADNIFKSIFLNENVWIPIKISLKFVPKSSINNLPALVQIMAFHMDSASEPIMVSLLMHICITRPQWVKDRQPNKWESSQAAYLNCSHEVFPTHRNSRCVALVDILSFNTLKPEHGYTKIKKWFSNYFHGFIWDVITHPCPNFNGGLIKPPLKLGACMSNYSFTKM